MRKSIIAILLPLLCVCFCENTHAQQRFKAGLVLGLNASQIRGDDSAGYNKLGIQGGLRAITLLQDKMDFVIEMLYSQRGSRMGRQLSPSGDLNINLQYIEVPLLIAYRDWLDEERDFYKLQATGGFTFSRLINATAVGSQHDAQLENFNNNDYGFTIGVEYFIGPKFSLGGRWHRSLNLLWDNQKHNKSLDALVGYFLSFRGVYIF